jgi:hypothetical protein
MLAKLIGIENRVWVRVGGCAPVYAIADEDLPRDTAEKTAAVHFLRFELDSEMAIRLKAGAALAIGIDHGNYVFTVSEVEHATASALVRDLV